MKKETTTVKGLPRGGNTGNGFDKRPDDINRAGGPAKTHWWTELYKKELERDSEKQKGLKKKESIVKSTVEKAEDGEQWAVKEVGDRVQGKAPQATGTLDDEGQFVPQDITINVIKGSPKP